MKTYRAVIEDLTGFAVRFKLTTPTLCLPSSVASLVWLNWHAYSSRSWKSVLGPPPVCLPVIQLVKEALLNRCTVPGYYGAIHACNGRNSQLLSSARARTHQFTTVNDKGTLLGKHRFPQSNLGTRCLSAWFREWEALLKHAMCLCTNTSSDHISNMFSVSVVCMPPTTSVKWKRLICSPRNHTTTALHNKKSPFVLRRMLEISNTGLANRVCHSENYSCRLPVG